MKNSKARNPTQEKNQRKFLAWHCSTGLDSTRLRQEEDKGIPDGYTQEKSENFKFLDVADCVENCTEKLWGNVGEISNIYKDDQ